jgi:hypothetical protein
VFALHIKKKKYFNFKFKQKNHYYNQNNPPFTNKI